MIGLLIIYGAGCLYCLIHIVISVPTLLATGHGVGRVQLGMPAWRVATLRGVEIHLGPVPIFAYVAPRTTTQITKTPPEIWDDPGARRAVAALASSKLERPVLPARFAAMSAAGLTFGLGALLYGGLPPLGSFLATAVTGPWWPWARGASILERGFAELTALPLSVAMGSVLTRWVALFALLIPLGLAAHDDRFSRWANIAVATWCLWIWTWLLAVPFAIW
jgi:hypothetical protein